MEYKDFLEFVCAKGMPELTDELLKVRKNAIPVKYIKMRDDEIPVGTSKSGGYPDLPQSIPYPIFAEWDEVIRDKTEHHPASAMQLLAQFNLEEVSPCDKDNLLPKTGMLYFFWSGELPDLPDNIEPYKIIYYDGGLSLLKRTPPPLPYYAKYFQEPLESNKLEFNSHHYEYDIIDEVPNYKEKFEVLDDIIDCLDFDDFLESGTKLLGVPSISYNMCGTGVNHINLLQYDVSMGSLWRICLHITPQDLAESNFDNAVFEYELD